jgi:hypothetical protein
MNTRPWTGSLIVLALVAALAVAADSKPPLSQTGQEPKPPDPQEGVEVLAYGPVHEAYAEPVTGQAKAPPAVPKEPPAPVQETLPDEKPEGDNVQWIPGYWAWDEEKADFLWVSGIWRIPPPGLQWIPGDWRKVEDSWQWVPGFWTPIKQNNVQDIQYLPPPPEQPEVEETVAAAPNADSVYAPGSWVYQRNQYLWQPGQWLTYKPGWVWVAAHYVWSPLGFRFVGGYWDWDLRRRGVLFAPVFVQQRFWNQSNWSFRPQYAIAPGTVLHSLFVRSVTNRYYFGNFFEPRFRRLGFVSWLDHRIGRRALDPLFSYYRWQFRGNAKWESDLRALYAARFKGEVPRPPRSLAQQRALIARLASQKADIRNLAMLETLHDINRRVIKLEHLAQAQRVELQKQAQQLRELSRERNRREAKGAIAKNRPVSTKLNVPKHKIVKHDDDDRLKPPARPVPPKAVPPTKTVVAKKPGDKDHPDHKGRKAVGKHDPAKRPHEAVAKESHKPPPPKKVAKNHPKRETKGHPAKPVAKEPPKKPAKPAAAKHSPKKPAHHAAAHKPPPPKPPRHPVAKKNGHKKH